MDELVVPFNKFVVLFIGLVVFDVEFIEFDEFVGKLFVVLVEVLFTVVFDTVDELLLLIVAGLSELPFKAKNCALFGLNVVKYISLFGLKFIAVTI